MKSESGGNDDTGDDQSAAFALRAAAALREAQDLFQDAWRCHDKRLLRMIQKRVGLLAGRRTDEVDHDVVDIYQEVHVRSWQRLKDFRGENFGGWVWTIAQNRLNDWAKSRHRRSSFPLNTNETVASSSESAADVSEHQEIIKDFAQFRSRAKTILGQIEALSQLDQFRPRSEKRKGAIPTAERFGHNLDKARCYLQKVVAILDNDGHQLD